jgi:hypothetical protein
MTLLSFLASIALGFLGGVAAWFATTLVGKPLARFFELRQEACEAIYVCANISAQTLDKARAERCQEELRRIAARVDALRSVLPRPVGWALAWRGYDLLKVTRGLTGLSNSLWTSDGSKAQQRVMAQRGLKLPVEPADLLQFERRERLEDVTF